MTLFRALSWSAAILFAGVFADVGTQRLVAQDEQSVDANGVEVLTRGPVHEAFAGTISFHPEPGVEVPKAPPEPIEELPPEQAPEGENVAWIPGYWAWDDERDDFLWISGVWRALPPGRQWVPGYWAEVNQAYQWTSGYWSDAATQEVAYLPEPPQSVEAGPNIEPPSADHVWIPGCWVWHDTRYLWRPGYWVVGQPNWIWIPAYYTWCPNGYVYVNGYWDYSVPRRGLLFAPIYFTSNIYARRGYWYSPLIVINTNSFVSQLFLRPNYHHYYFGDYYAASYTNAGFYPWFRFNASRRGYDPFYAQYRWQHRGDRNWEQRIQADFKHRVEHQDARPPRTFAELQKRTKGGQPAEGELLVATSVDRIAKVEGSPIRLRKINSEERQNLVKQSQEVQHLRAERKKGEAAERDQQPGKNEKVAERPKLRLPKSPIVAKTDGAAGQDQAPPKAPEAPKVDTRVEPKARAPRVREHVADDKMVPNRPAGRNPKNAPGAETTPDAEPQAPAKPARRPETKPDPKPERKPEPKPERKPDPKPMPKPEPQPKVEPKPMPTPPAPKEVQPTQPPMPKVKPEPKPRKRSKPEGGNKPEGGKPEKS